MRIKEQITGKEEMRTEGDMGKRRETLCWQCENAVPNHKGRGCEWSRRFRPVPGWTAQEMCGSLPGEESDGKQGGNQQRGNDVPET